jgi:error-prone DNA polymerase
VRPVDINCSDWDHTLEPGGQDSPRTESGGSAFALRLGIRQIDGMREEAARRIVECRARGFDSVRDLYFRARVDMGTMQRLARADAFRSIGLDRRAALWAVRGLSGHLNVRSAVEDLPLFRASEPSAVPFQVEEDVVLPPLLPGEHVIEDYTMLSLSLKAHPVSFLRRQLAARGMLASKALRESTPGKLVRVGGLVLVRQRPGTASGVIFMTTEDETGTANIIVWPKIFERHRRIVLGAHMVGVEGVLQKEKDVIHVIARRLFDLTSDLFDTMRTFDPVQPADLPARPTTSHLWRHPRDTQVLPKGRNFH